MNILIVDDHPLFRHALIQAVRYARTTANIAETATVAEFYAFRAWSRTRYCIVGFALTRCIWVSALVHVRAQYPAIPIVVVSAHEELDHSVVTTRCRWRIFQNPPHLRILGKHYMWCFLKTIAGHRPICP